MKYTEKFDKDLDIVCGYTDVDLEGRFDHVRAQETNLADLIADIIRTEYDADFGLLNSGTLRSNSVIHKGPITHKMIMNMLPMPDKIVLAKIKG